MKKDTSVFLKHILESINLIEQYKEGLSEENFHKSTEKQDVIVRRLEIIGEATKNLPADFLRKTSRYSLERNGRNERQNKSPLFRYRLQYCLGYHNKLIATT